jgi:hypothetical protein
MIHNMELKYKFFISCLDKVPEFKIFNKTQKICV